ncbi:MAG: hypothetical protein Athens071426_176 [Parcubacteria group bacterium Athens0714_26]|nr:MAG: hypothetical protein Athens101426_402 [Parcubacteria group bacterium Athens1014_26]TSD03579.1 MAG: hypothetical protein Athens071426_176 [Parcubacteria group bacterium Athens0714_26]
MSKLIFDIETVGEDFDVLDETTNVGDIKATKELYDYWQNYINVK